MESNNLLFVYGTLMSCYTGYYARFLRQSTTLLGRASCQGGLCLVSWYPGLVPGRQGTVWGELYQLRGRQSVDFWEVLDSYEGILDTPVPEYVRQIIDVHTEGRLLQAWSYIYVGKANSEWLPNGTFEYPLK